MFIGAHSDDIELGCGGILPRHIDRGDNIVYAVLTRGECGGDPGKRMAKIERVTEYLGPRDYVLPNFPDTRLHEHFTEVKDAIEDLVKRLESNHISTHSFNDKH